MTEYDDPDLETLAPLGVAPVASDHGGYPPAPGRTPLSGLVAALIVVSLVIGFGTATLVLNARDSGPTSVTFAPVPSTTTPTFAPPGGTPSTTPRRVPADPEESVLGDLILHQREVGPTATVSLLDQGTDLSVPTLDLCNGRFPSEADRTARRQVVLSDDRGLVHMSTEAVLYRRPAMSAEAFGELRSVAVHCPSVPVTSPVGEGTATTRFSPAPDAAWPRVRSVDRLAYDFTSVDAGTGDTSHSVAVYIRRGRALVGLYFAQPIGPQAPVGGRTTIAGIVALFEARLAAVPARRVGA